ncbi:gamma carbonic anhydrase family protein [Methylogaea oryzae]|uniref:Gamma carbonic anhydrase family protein n=1 Tax=Methylogaea oryzae TaxID=1295382 RepID=A0A8D4VU43_9GAMM|nr:gamma carbonic anhydrase family protein [Methylogaea oryzae]BBL72544.1 gamma carbonic anhydrase family protein [Methylogaea oryzae]
MTIRAFGDKRPSLGQLNYVDDSAVVIGDVHLGNHVSIWPTAVVRGDVERIDIGEATNIQDGSVLHVSHHSPYSNGSYPLKIGRGVTVGHKAVLHGCTVGDYCLIGIGALVMDGAVIEDEVMLGAGALVPPGKRLESGHLYVGAPARQARPLKEEEKQFLRYSAQHYVHLKDEHLKHQGSAS